MVAPRLAERAVHALLHHYPLAVVGDDEAMQVELKTVLHRGAVHLGHQAARLRQRRAIQSNPLADGDELVRRLPRMLSAPAADVNAELALKRGERALERADHAGGDAGGMPVHSHHGAERLEPER